MRADDGTIDDGTSFVDANSKRLVDAFPRAACCPTTELVVDRFPGSKALGQITPWDAGSGAVDHRINEQTLILRGRAAFSLR